MLKLKTLNDNPKIFHMTDFLPNVILYFGCYLAFILTTYAIGHLFITCFNTFVDCDDTQRTFFKVIFGTVILVTLFAIFWTKGNSVFWIALLSLSFFVYENRKEFIKPKYSINTEEFKEILKSLILFCILFFASYLSIFVWRQGMSIFGDTLYYSNVSSVLIQSHVETTELFEQVCATPYHYGELWFNGLISSTFGLNYYFTLFLITYPFWLALSGIGAICLSKFFIPNEKLCTLLGLCFILFAPLSGNCIYCLNHIIYSKTFEFSNPVIASFKLAPLCALMLGYTISLFSKRYLLTALFAGLIASFYSPSGPAIIINSVFIFAYKHNGAARILNKYSLFCIAISLCIIIFYVINKITNTTDIPISLCYTINVSAALPRFGKLILLETCIISVPIVLYLFINKKDYLREKIRLIIYYLVFPILLVGILSAVISQIHLDGEQLFINYAVIINNIACFLFILYISRRINKSFFCLIPISVLLFIMLPQRGILYHQLKMPVGKEFAKEASAILSRIKEYDNEKQLEYGYFANYEKRYSPSNLHLLRLNLSYPCTEFMYMSSPSGIYKPYCLSAMNIPKDIDARFYDTPKSQIYKFIQQQIASGSFSNNDDAIESFILDKNIGFILIEDGAIVPDKISTHLDSIAKINNVSLFHYLR